MGLLALGRKTRPDCSTIWLFNPGPLIRKRGLRSFTAVRVPVNGARLAQLDAAPRATRGLTGD